MAFNLLPKSRQEFASKSYWDNFFVKRKTTFEWYGEYIDFCEFIHKYCERLSPILMVGCGNSKLSEDMYDAGFEGIVNIDISDLVIQQMLSKNQTKRRNMKYLKMDITNCNFENESFKVVLDKGTLDAMFTDENKETLLTIKKMFDEITRLVMVGGRYLCVSLAQPHIVKYLLQYFANDWFIKVHKIEIVEKDSEKGLGTKFPVFLFVFTKAKQALAKTFLELNLFGVTKRFNTQKEMLENIKELQDFSIVQNRLQSGSLKELVSVDIFKSYGKNSDIPRYSITLVDTPRSSFTCQRNGSYGVFIVPQGQEFTDTFRTDKGKRDLACMVGFDRLAVVILNHGHTYKDIDEIKSELSEKVMSLLNKGINTSELVPFLTSGDSVGSRNIKHEGDTDKHGSIVVEDIQSAQGFYYRQLIFLHHPQYAPLKARLMIHKGTKKKVKTKKRVVDHRYLTSSYVKKVLAGVVLSEELKFDEFCKLRILFVGLRSSCLIGFMCNLFPQIVVDIVAEDNQLKEVIENSFGILFSNVEVGTLETFVERDKLYDVIIYDSYLDGDLVFLNCLKDVANEKGILIHATSNYQEDSSKNVDTLHHVTYFDDNRIKVTYYIPKTNNEFDFENPKKFLIQKSKILKEFLFSSRKDFYEKNEWDDLDNCENLFFEYI